MSIVACRPSSAHDATARALLVQIYSQDSTPAILIDRSSTDPKFGWRQILSFRCYLTRSEPDTVVLRSWQREATTRGSAIQLSYLVMAGADTSDFEVWFVTRRDTSFVETVQVGLISVGGQRPTQAPEC
jgi:hypothetical protein